MEGVEVAGFGVIALLFWLLLAVLRYAGQETRRQRALERTLGRPLTLAEARAYWNAEQTLPKARMK